MAQEPEARQACLHLRTKEMFYKDPASADPEREALMARLYGRSETRVFWCQCTQTGRGPDDQPVSPTECRRPGRACYRGLEHLT
jgi:hypothetical protein